MKISEFDYDLPREKIAIYPPKERGKTRLLVLNKKNGQITHSKYEDLHKYVNEGDLLILNNTKVIKARLKGVKSTGGKVELLLLEKHKDDKDSHVHKAIYKGHLKQGDVVNIGKESVKVERILANGVAEITSSSDLVLLTERAGEIPIPPYLDRESEELDEERYQTVFAKNNGSVAAPTASLNFTDDLRGKLLNKGVQIKHLTLHVGLGTFMPVREDDVEKHKMHEEFYILPKETVEAIRDTKKNNKRVIAVGTTVTRALEHAAGKILSNSPISNIEGEADIFIYPGFEFKVVDALVTNFHAPRSTVLLLASAFAGAGNLKNAYQEALKRDYKFLSYGDSMFVS